MTADDSRDNERMQRCAFSGHDLDDGKGPEGCGDCIIINGERWCAMPDRKNRDARFTKPQKWHSFTRPRKSGGQGGSSGSARPDRYPETGSPPWSHHESPYGPDRPAPGSPETLLPRHADHELPDIEPEENEEEEEEDQGGDTSRLNVMLGMLPPSYAYRIFKAGDEFVGRTDGEIEVTGNTHEATLNPGLEDLGTERLMTPKDPFGELAIPREPDNPLDEFARDDPFANDDLREPELPPEAGW